MLKRAEHYRTDIWLGRYMGHPWTAITHLGAGIGMVYLLAAQPSLHYGLWGWLCALVPGVWLLMLGMSFPLWAIAKLMGMSTGDIMLTRRGNTWAAQTFTREAFAFVVLALLGGFTLDHNVQANWSRPFDQHDYLSCVSLLDMKGQARLAKDVSEGMPRREFWLACQTAQAADQPKPGSFAQLKKVNQH